MTAPHRLTLAEASGMIAARKLSPVELLADCTARITAFNPGQSPPPVSMATFIVNLPIWRGRAPRP